MEQSWEEWPVHMDEEDEEEFLRDILLQQPELCSESESHQVQMPRTFILSFDNSTIIPAAQHPPQMMMKHNKSNKSRNRSQILDHILAERKRRQDLSQKFIALSATIPSLHKTDKASILREAINYVKQLQERVAELERQSKKGAKSVVLVKKKSDVCTNDSSMRPCWDDESLPDVGARVLGKDVLIEIHCERQNGIEVKILDLLENLHLNLTGTSVLPFGTSTLGITVIAQDFVLQMGDAYTMTLDDLVRNVREVLFIHTHHPF